MNLVFFFKERYSTASFVITTQKQINMQKKRQSKGKKERIKRANKNEYRMGNKTTCGGRKLRRERNKKENCFYFDCFKLIL